MSCQSSSDDSQDSSWSDLLGSMQSLNINNGTSTRSRAGSDSSSQPLNDFFSDSGAFSSTSSSLGTKGQKLALWQAILITVGLCEPQHGTTAMTNLKRPKHFPHQLLPLPSSLTACKKLIREYVFVNIRDFKASQTRKGPLKLFSRYVLAVLWSFGLSGSCSQLNCLSRSTAQAS